MTHIFIKMMALRSEVFSVKNNFIFFYKSFKLLPYKVSKEVWFAMVALIKLFVSLSSVFFLIFC